MTLKFILGLAKVDHRQAIINDIDFVAKKNDDAKFFYLVPNHIKFDAEVDILSRYGNKKNNQNNQKEDLLNVIAETRLQVFSIKRLVWYFMANSSVYKKDRISKSGLFMLVRRAFQNAQGLQIFQRMSQKAGFIEQLATQISELRLSNINSFDLKELALQSSGELKQKLSDLSIILSLIEDETVDKLITDTDLLNSFADWLENENLPNMNFYFESFSQFTIPERRILEILIKKADVTLALITDINITNQLKNGRLPIKSFFGRTNKLINELVEFAKQKNIDVSFTKNVDNIRPVNKGISLFENAWLQSYGVKIPKLNKVEQQIAKGVVEIYAAESLQTEVEQFARYIRQKVSDKNNDYRYKDFLIVARDLNQYETMIEPIFSRYEIPIFTDLDFSMTSHPLVEFMKALLEISDIDNKNYYQYYTLMQLLKTQLLRPKEFEANEFRTTLDSLENYVLAFNPRNSDWRSQEDWIYTKSQGNEEDWQLISVDENINSKINLVRKFIVKAIEDIRTSLKNAKTVSDAVKKIYQWLIDFGVLDVLNEWRYDSLENDDLINAKQPEEAWKMLINTLDEMVNLIGDDDYDPTVFTDTIIAGFSGAKFSGIPASIDKVQISEMGIVQNDNYKVVMMLGGTKLNLPAHIQNHALLSDQNRQEVKLITDEIYLRDTSQQQMAEEPLLAYLSWLCAKELLVLSYPLRNTEGTTQKISPYLERIAYQLNINLDDITVWQDQPNLNDSLVKVKRFVGTTRSTLNYLSITKQKAKIDKTPLPKIWQYLDDYLVDNEPLTKKILSSIEYTNQSEILDANLVEALFKNKVQVSISKLETYNQNPYEYFLRHGLKLQERPIFELTVADSGQIFHKILETAINSIIKARQELGNLTQQETKELIRQEAKKAFDDPAFKILKSSSRMEFVQQQLLKIVGNTFNNVRKAGNLNNSKPYATEITFGNSYGKNNNWQGLNYDLGNGKSMQINGKIDRLDTDSVGSNLFVNVIDYKSGQKKFDYTMAYNGLSLQLLTYLLAVQKNTNKLNDKKVNTNQQVKLGGALFAHISNPKKKLKDIGLFNVDVLSNDGLNIIDDEITKDFNYQGLLVKDSEFLQSLELDLGYPGKAKYYDFSFTKKGIGSSNTVIDETDLKSLLAYNENTLKNTGSNILAGKFPIQPVRYNNKTSALQYSPYTAIMGFDVMVDNEYKQLEKIDAKEMLEISHLTEFVNVVNQFKGNENTKQQIEKHFGIIENGFLTDIKALENDTVDDALKHLGELSNLDIRQKNAVLKSIQVKKNEEIEKQNLEKKVLADKQKAQDKILKQVAKVVKKQKNIDTTSAVENIEKSGDVDFNIIIPQVDILKGLTPNEIINYFQNVSATKLDDIVLEVKKTIKEQKNG